MATSGNRGHGRRSKGERRYVGSRIPVEQADRLTDVAKHEGITVNDMIAVAIEEKMAAYDVMMLSDDQLVDLLHETKMALDGEVISEFAARKVVEQLVILNRDLLPGLSATSNSK